MAGALSESRENRPLIVVIDELDRCRPSYAVELLEVAKHLFAVDHIVFVLAVNRSELAHSIRALYGSEFDAQGYLRRFFDVDFRLPDPDRKAFINEMLVVIGIDGYFERIRYPDNIIVPDLLLHFFSEPSLSLRRIAQAVHRLGLVFASLRGDQRFFSLTAAVALILRTVDSDLYHRFVRGEVSDLKVVDAVFDGLGTKDLKKSGNTLFEAVIIVAAQENEFGQLPDSVDTPLLQKYQALVSDEETDSASHDPERRYARAVIQNVKDICGRFQTSGIGIGFRYSVKRIELLSVDLLEKP